MPQHIQSTDISVDELFQSFYAVPDYQREYVWGTEEVEQLLNDVLSEMSGESPENYPEYFIGSIVICPGKDGLYDLIDGQQRLTTLYIILCSIRDRLEILQDNGLDTLNRQIASASTDISGRETQRYRLDLQYKDSGNALISIARGQPLHNTPTQSIKNIGNAHKVVTKFLASEFGDNPDMVRGFYGYLTNKVKLIRILTEDIAKALKIFETINDRGVGLNSMDLLKNLLFMKTTPSQYDQLKSKWEELQNIIYNMNEKPLRFLRYFVMSRYEVTQIIREDNIYGWFAHNESLVGYGNDPIGFADELVKAAGAYKKFLRDGCDEQGKANRYLENMRILGGSAARQHLILLLAGRHLSSELFERLAREVENLFFCYVVTREPTRNFESNFLRWAAELRNLSSTVDFDDFIEKRFVKTKIDLSTRFGDAIGRMEYGSIQQYRLRYLLAKLSQHIDLKAYGENAEGHRWLKYYTSGGFEIEHIFPRNPSNPALEEFGPYEDMEITEKLGNLVLVEEPINRSLGNKPYSEKRKIYPKSKLVLTKSLPVRPSVGQDTRFDKAVSEIEPFEIWNENTVNARQQHLVKLSRTVWDVRESRSPRSVAELSDAKNSDQEKLTRKENKGFEEKDLDDIDSFRFSNSNLTPSSANIPNREVVWNAVQELTKGDSNIEFAIKDLKPIIETKYPKFVFSNLGPEIHAYCANSPSREHYRSAGNYCYYWKIERGKYRLYDEDRDK